jgi:hypothetical protein
MMQPYWAATHCGISACVEQFPDTKCVKKALLDEEAFFLEISTIQHDRTSARAERKCVLAGWPTKQCRDDQVCVDPYGRRTA